MRSRPRITVQYLPPIVRPGDEVTVDIDLECRSRTPVDSITVTLRYHHQQLGTGYSLVRRRLGSVSFQQTVLHPGVHTRTAKFTIPADAHPSYEDSQVRIVYDLGVEVDIPWWPNVSRFFELQVAPRRESLPDGREFQAWLEENVIAPGGTLTGRFTASGLRPDEALFVNVVFLATRKGTEVYRSAHSVHRVPIPGSEPVQFRARLPKTAPCHFEPGQEPSWRIDIIARKGRHGTTESIPIQVVAPDQESSPADERRGPTRLGPARQRRTWSDIAARLDYALDEERLCLSLRSADVTAQISVEDTPSGAFLVGKLDWPPLGLGLSIAPRRFSDVLRPRIETGDTELDRRFQVQAREPAQAIALLGDDVRAALLDIPQSTLGDDGARLAEGGTGHEEEAVERFASRVGATVRALARAIPQVPPPAAVARFAPTWRAWAGRAGGRLEMGRLWIHRADWHGSTVDIGTSWTSDSAAATAEGTVLRVHLNPPLHSAIDPEKDATALPGKARAWIGEIMAEMPNTVFGPDAVKTTLGFVALDPEDALPALAKLVRVALALQGRHGSGYR